MNNPDHERLREIESSAKKVDELAKILDFQRQEAKFARQAWEEAVERHLELCRATEDSHDVAKAPLLRRIEELGAEANGQATWPEDTLSALLSVGHTPAQGRAMVNRAIESGRQFGSVNDAIDWIYSDGQPIVADAVTEPPEPSAEHEEDEPDWHGEPVVSDLTGHRLAGREQDEPEWPKETAGWTQEEIDEHDEMHRQHPVVGSEVDDDHDRDGWDLVTSRPLSDDAKAEADALAAIEAGGKKAKGRKRSKAQQG